MDEAEYSFFSAYAETDMSIILFINLTDEIAARQRQTY